MVIEHDDQCAQIWGHVLQTLPEANMALRIYFIGFNCGMNNVNVQGQVLQWLKPSNTHAWCTDDGLSEEVLELRKLRLAVEDVTLEVDPDAISSGTTRT